MRKASPTASQSMTTGVRRRGDNRIDVKIAFHIAPLFHQEVRKSKSPKVKALPTTASICVT
jgi:hypothetical protein